MDRGETCRTLKTSVFWGVASCILVERMIPTPPDDQIVRTSETSVSFYQTARRSSSEDIQRLARFSENLLTSRRTVPVWIFIHSFTHSQALIVQDGPLVSLSGFLDQTHGKTPLDE
jgi:hypothetical protein